MSRASASRAVAQLAKTDKALTRLVTARALDDDMPAAVYEQAHDELLGKRAEFEKAVAAAAQAETLNAGDYLPIVAGLLEWWDSLPPSRKRDLLAKVSARVMIYRTGVRQSSKIEIIPVWGFTRSSGERVVLC